MDLNYYVANIVKCSPLLLIGGYVPEFKKIDRMFTSMNKSIFTFFYFREKADIDEFLSNNSGRRFPSVLVIDLGVRVVPLVDRLLKFVEEYHGPLIITSSQDINNLVFLSRFKLELRKSTGEVTFMIPSHKNTLSEGITEDTKLSDPIIWEAYSKGLSNFTPLMNYRKAEESARKCMDILFG